jgi:hypothetical protein
VVGRSGVEEEVWYRTVRWIKFILLWVSLLLSLWGAVRFTEALWALGAQPKIDLRF